ncbi:sigma-54 interaction domain-containing protein [Bacillus massiliigorillae]|uniref:sigma-54 interaction domain-containing protein n=1 Tax=Bacillus massiliigorillae TaxID=1243664 RepID=UPI00039B98A3|nr:sigma 54-interacting transcriptional regulator [Bacillus massiliigorillae]
MNFTKKHILKQEHLIQALEQSFEGLLLSDIEGRVFYANRAVEQISGFSKKDIVGKTPMEMEEDGLIVSQSMKVVKKDPLTISQMLSTGREVFITSKPVFDYDGKIICYIANYRELSTLNELHKEHHNQLDINYTELQQLRAQLLKTDNWIGNSYKTKILKEKVTKVAKTEAIVLIVGESGVGKEVISKNIHKISDRKNAPYIQINCGAIPESLIEAELFGYEKGAFTGASSAKPGLLEVANGGTILLDEIGEMPLHLQVKLLRVIQTKEITRVGSTKVKKLDVRFLAATNRDLKELVQQGKFREDLYYRLNVIPIPIPSLRERKEDILTLSYHFLTKFNAKYTKNKRLSEESQRLIVNYKWPGNVRQLENTIEHLVILTETDEILPIDLPKEITKISFYDFMNEIIPLKVLREENEIKMINMALSRFKSIREAAKHLDVDHSTLVKKIKKYEIDY